VPIKTNLNVNETKAKTIAHWLQAVCYLTKTE
jgi:hypothetical protein